MLEVNDFGLGCYYPLFDREIYVFVAEYDRVNFAISDYRALEGGEAVGVSDCIFGADKF